MNPWYNGCAKLAIAALAASLIAGCSGQAQSTLTPSGLSNAAHHVGPLDDPSTLVGIKNDWTSEIGGTSNSAMCWTISSSLPTVGAGDLSSPIKLTYTPLCPTSTELDITYGPLLTTANTCTFHVQYSSGFEFTVTDHGNAACSVTPSPTTGYDYYLIYDQSSPPGAKHIRSR